MTRQELETAVGQVLEGRPLPTIYLRQQAGDDGAPRYVACYVLMCRVNGFMICMPDVEVTADFLNTLLSADGVLLSLSLQVELPCETARGRQLGPGALLLVDLPWESLQHFVRSHPLQAAIAGEGLQRLTVLQVDGTSAHQRSADALQAAHNWIDDLDPQTAQEYHSGSEDVELLPEQGAARRVEQTRQVDPAPGLHLESEFKTLPGGPKRGRQLKAAAWR